jgi:signal transduction histidine kinase
MRSRHSKSKPAAHVRDSTQRKRAERRAAIQYAVTRTLADASLEEATPKVMEVICQHAGWDLGALWYVDRGANVLRRSKSWHAPTLSFGDFEAVSAQMTFAPGVGLPGRVWLSGEPAWIVDVLKDMNFPRGPAAAEDGLHGGFGFPIRVGGAVIGVIELFSRQVRQPDEDLLQMLAPLGSQIGLFIERRDREHELRQREEAAQFLADAGNILAESLNYRETLASVARLAVPRVADWCLIDILEADGQLHRLEAVHSDPAKIQVLNDLARRYPSDSNDARGKPQVLQTGKAELYEEIPDSLLMDLAKDEVHLELLRSLGLASAMLVPLTARGHILGVITLITGAGESGRRYHASDLALAEELARRTGLAVDNARLYRAAHNEIAERKRAEEVIHRLNQTLERRVAERTAALKETNEQMEAFCYSVSHDLRAPLRAMQGFSQALLEDYEQQLDETGREFARRIVKSAEHMDSLIQDLLAYSRLSRLELKFEPVELDTVMASVLSVLSEEQKRKDARIEVKRPLPQVVGHPATLEQVLTNLISNALKFVAPNVVPRVDVWGEAGDGWVRLWVEDNGIGIEPEFHERIFRVFERLHGAGTYPGTGIGLAIVRKAIERMGGRVGVSSAAGRGSRFWIELQRAL